MPLADASDQMDAKLKVHLKLVVRAGGRASKLKAARLRSIPNKGHNRHHRLLFSLLSPSIRSFGFPSHWLIRGLWVGLPACLTPRRRGSSFSPDFPLSRKLQDGRAQAVGRIRYFHPLGDLTSHENFHELLLNIVWRTEGTFANEIGHFLLR